MRRPKPRAAPNEARSQRGARAPPGALEAPAVVARAKRETTTAPATTPAAPTSCSGRTGSRKIASESPAAMTAQLDMTGTAIVSRPCSKA